jgi:hypothetical protein
MQDFAPFTPELLGLIGQLNNFLDNLNFDLVVQMTTKYFWEFLTLLFTELNSVSLQS